MRTPPALAIFALLAAPLAVPPAPAQAATAAVLEAETDNAALLYLRYAALLQPDNQLGWKPGEPLTPVQAATLEQGYADAIEGVLRASRLPDCDFGIEYDEGMYALLPHLTPMRRLAGVLCADAVRLSERGDPAGAAERLAAVVRMSRHLEGDRVMISALVSISTLNNACVTIGQIADAHGFDDGARATLLAALGTVDRRNPGDIEGAIVKEGAFLPGWFVRTFTGPDAGEQAAAVFAQVDPGVKPEALAALRALDASGVEREAAKYQRYCRDMLDAMRADDADARVQAVTDRMSDTDRYGAFCPAMGFSGPPVLRSIRACRANLDRAERALGG